MNTARFSARAFHVELAPEELVEVLHAVLHRRLVRTLVAAPLPVQGGAPGVDPQRDLVVLVSGFEVRSLLGFDELALEEGDLLRIIELDDVGCPVDRARDQRTDNEHVWIPLDHDVRVVHHPDCPCGGVSPR